MKTVLIKTETPYTLTVCDSFENMRFDFNGNKICIVSDTNVAPLYSKQVSEMFGQKKVLSVVVEAGEKSKSIENWQKLVATLADNYFSRGDAVVALGGGVVGDLAGFVAATYMRGIKLFQIPTSLLAMIDSSVGGKTAVNLPQGKNLVGAFYQPSGVYVNISTLKTLPLRELQNGMGELVKYAFLNKSVSEEKINCGVTPELIADCVAVKAEIVSQDEKEKGRRALLNLGHTVGHALEKLSGFSMPHGLCVAKGIACAISLSQKYYGFSLKKAEKMMELLSCAAFDTTLPYSKKEILEEIRHDKKSFENGVNFVTIKDIGCCEVSKLTFDKLEELL